MRLSASTPMLSAGAAHIASTSVSEPSDETVAWVQRALTGDEEAFAWLTRHYEPRLFVLLQRRLGTMHGEVDDALQETWTRAYRSLNRYDARYRFSTWLFTIGLRVATDLLRARQRRSLFARTENDWESILDARPASHPHYRLECAEWWDRAQRCLSPQQATALWLRYAEDLSIREIATIMGKTQIGIRVMLHRARLLLVERMDDRQNMEVETAETGEAT